MRRNAALIVGIALAAGLAGCGSPEPAGDTDAPTALPAGPANATSTTSGSAATSTTSPNATSKSLTGTAVSATTNARSAATSGDGTAGTSAASSDSALTAVASPKPTSYLHVSPGGSDSARGTASAPLRSVQRAVDLAAPGTGILLHAGTYSGQVKIRKSGTASAPIHLTTAGDGAVKLTSSPAKASCSSRQPAPDRTILVGGGADHWRIYGLSIHNGIYISGQEVNAAYQYFTRLVQAKDWRARRAIPGRGTKSTTAAKGAVDYLAGKTGKALNPSDGLQIVGNTITGRGIHAAMSRYGTISANTISAIDCGTGPGVWLIAFSDGWQLSNNYVHHIAASTAAHFMQEGIRIGSSSNYNVVTGNRIEDLPGDGRAFNTDVDSSWNTIQGNTARRVAIGFNDQMAGWGNTWTGNTVTEFRTYGFAFRLMDGGLAQPSNDTSTFQALVKCNAATGSGPELGIGGIMDSSFASNTFSPVMLSKNSRGYWGAQSNLWNGSAVPPEPKPPVTSTGC